MGKRKTYLHLMGGFLVLLFWCQAGYLHAADQPEKANAEVAMAEPNTTSNSSPASVSIEINELRSLIADQQKQIEKLESKIEQQQSELERTMSAVVVDSGTGAILKDASLTGSAAPANAVAQNNPPAAGDAGKPATPKPELPAALKSFKPIALFYLSYQNGSKYSGTPGTTTDYNQFVLKRGYFGADMDVTPFLTGRFVADVYQDGETATKNYGNWGLRLKYLYGKFHWKGNDVITNPYVEFGLTHMPWLDYEEAINGFRMQDTMFLERNGIFNSADTGVLVGSDLGGSLGSEYKSKVNSHYAGRFGSWQVGIYNGGGYHAPERNTNKAFEGRFSFRPLPDLIPGLQFSVLGVVGKGNLPSTNNIEPPDWRVFNGMVSYESQYFTFTGQGYFGTGNQAGTALQSGTLTAADQNGFSVFASVHIPMHRLIEKISILGRFDEFDSNTHIPSDVQRRYITGFALHLYKSNILLFDFERLNHSATTIPGENRGQITLQFSL